MPDPFPRLAVSRTLWLVVAPLVVGLVWHIAVGLRGRRAPEDPWLRRVGIGSILAASGAILWNAGALVCSPSQTRGFIQPELGGARLAALDAGFGLVFDRPSGVVCSIACAVGLAVASVIVRRGLDDRRWQVWAWIELSLAGALLSFLASGFSTTLLGWGLSTSAAAWLAGWSNPRAGAVRAARGALAILAVLVGSALLFWGRCGHWDGDGYILDAASVRAPAGDLRSANGEAPSCGTKLSFRDALDEPVDGRASSDTRYPTSLALVAFLLASAAMSASTPRPGSPPVLAAVECGATTGLLGPFLLLRLADSAPAAPEGAALIGVGVGLLAWLFGAAWSAPAGTARWLEIASGTPIGLTLVALGADGPYGGLLVLVVAGVSAALLLSLAAVLPGVTVTGAFAPSAGHTLVGRSLDSAATLLVAFERWVVDGIAGAVRVLVGALAWALARFDVHAGVAQSDALATRAVRIGRGLEPFVGGSLARVTWAVLAALAFVALAHALWPAR